jgi:hypothetical protein
MGEHAERANDAEPEAPAKRSEIDWHKTKDTTVSFVAWVVRWAGLIFATILVLHVIFEIGEANTVNGIVSFVTAWAKPLSLGFKDLFQPSDPKLSVLVNYGIAAIFWLIVSAVLAKVVRRVGGTS